MKNRMCCVLLGLFFLIGVVAVPAGVLAKEKTLAHSMSTVTID